MAPAGNRLGAPVPGVTSSSSLSSNAVPGAFPTAGGSTSAAAPAAAADPAKETKFAVDLAQPTTSIQIRLGDGTRLVARVNLTHTVRDIRGFIDACVPLLRSAGPLLDERIAWRPLSCASPALLSSRPASADRSYALQTTFPNKDLADEDQTIADGKLENAVVVQRWT
jgi:UBX domain-containing protein 1